MFIQEDMMDARKSGIVIACVALFLGLWSIVLFSQRKPAEPSASIDQSVIAVRSSRSKAGIATLALLLTGVMAWFVGIGTWQQLSLAATTALGWIAAFCFTAAATAGIIALSSKTPDRGKWFGLLGLAGFASAFVVFVIRMTP